MKSIILMGIKHCGKSTQGRLLAEKLSLPFYDTDSVISEMTGKSPRKIFTSGGESAFKLAETAACKEIEKKLEKENAVIATGGGICNNSEALALLHKLGTFVFLMSSEKVAADRICREAHTDENGKLTNLPAYIAKENPSNLQQVRAIFHDFYEERVRLYAGIADLSVKVDGTGGPCPKPVNTKRILSALGLNAEIN